MERQVALPTPPSLGGSEPRRGVILLVILSLLTLFMMLGATYLVMASRARVTAKAFAAANNGSRNQINSGLGESFVDEALLSVVRGSPNNLVTTTGSASLLADKYGADLPITGSLVGSATGSLIVSFISSVSGTQSVEQLNGRVLTFQTPTLTTASVRILRAEPVPGSTTVKLFIPDGPTLSGANLSSSLINSSVSGLTESTHFIINGREFASGSTGPNEPYDAYDTNNDFLGNPLAPATRPSYSVSGTTASRLTIDNDGDGVLDSAWIDVGLPAFDDATGNKVYPRAAILVTDLDGRLNVNVHGSRVAVDYPASFYPSTFATGSNAMTTVTTSTASFSTKSFGNYPDGLGFGPAETSLEQTTLFPGASLATSATSSWSTLTEGIASSSSSNDPNTKRPPPNLGSVEGRYGGEPTVAAGLPGRPDVNDPISSTAQAWIATEGSAYFTSPGRYGSPPDVRGRMKVFVDDYGQPVYYKPYWNGTASSISQDEVVDDPYEINLSRLSPRPGWGVNTNARNGNQNFSYANVADNLFSAADIEAVLRIYDPDSRTLPQRLIALSGTQATGNRLMLTTDSWDSSAMTGPLRNNISRLITSATATVPLTGTNGRSAYEMFAPETLMGHKFDLNRPFHPTDTTEPYDATGIAERQKFAKHLYSLLYVVAGGTTVTGTTADTLAQWAVNVVDFRDDDSINTGFEYDRNLADGWTVDDILTTGTFVDGPDRAIVWGAERPEILVTENVCWHDRQTDDTKAGTGTEDTVVDGDKTSRDNDFDQQRRPQGAFFFELYSPWDSQLAEYDAKGIKAVRRTIQGGTSSLLRAEPIPAELASGTVATGTAALAGNALGRFDLGATLNLSRLAPDGTPVWRVITLKTGSSLPTVTDPVITLSGTVWRSFYFKQPPAALVRTTGNGDVASGSNAVAFWPAVSATSTITLPPQTPKVFGSDSSLTGNGTSVVAMDTIFLSATGTSSAATTTRDATLSEPLITLGDNASYDPYAVLYAQSATGATSWPLSTAADTPLDNVSFSASGVNTLTLAGTNTLFQNGRHSNYFLLHLQRLANPSAAWNEDSNPYVTIDTQPVDLFVYNTGSTALFPGVSPNYEEPTVAPDAFIYAFDGYTKRIYDDGEDPSLSGAAATISLERGNTQVSGTTDKDIWSARVNASGTTVSGTNDTGKWLSISSTTVPASVISPPYSSASNATFGGSEITWTNDSYGKLETGTLVSVAAPQKSQHSLGSLAPRFSSGAGNPNLPVQPFPWMFWANRPFTSAAELAFVPTASSFNLLRLHATASGTGSDKLSTGWFGHLPRFFEPVIYGSATTTLVAPWDVISGRNATTGSSNGGSSPSLWDAVHVASPFGGSYATLSLTSGSTALQPLGLDKRPYGQLPTFREAGRVNVNTITGSTTWLAVLGSGTQIPTTSGSFTVFNPPATSFIDVLQKVVSTSGTTFIDRFTEANRDTDKNSYFRYQTVNRVANNVTIRSNVFAVWVTVGFFDAAGNEYGADTGAIQRYRGFYIYDRSIPVGFSAGKDYNVRDGIMLRRIIP